MPSAAPATKVHYTKTHGCDAAVQSNDVTKITPQAAH